MKIRKKNFLSFVLATIILSVSLQPVAAQTNVLDDSQLKEIAQKYEVEVFVLSDSELEELEKNGPLPSFNDFDEYESFVAESVSELKKVDTVQKSVLEVPLKTDSTITPMYQTSHTLNWWAPFAGVLGGVAAWKNIAIVYDYEFRTNGNSRPYFTGVSSISSYLTGLQIAVTWNQTTGTKTYSNTCWEKDTANFVIQGYYLIGAEMYGVPVGFKVNDTWNRSLQLQTSGLGCF
ncbi:hypothetical protein [Paenibacillus daejeonensis]|uniref:hypothetical protein n=1 Tax=Paenibacillus daejeonensis TaxID=135193 RepID=UPI00037C2415|nr:hypothetical protein [Paenibacillus daejeonensis]